MENTLTIRFLNLMKQYNESTSIYLCNYIEKSATSPEEAEELKKILYSYYPLFANFISIYYPEQPLLTRNEYHFSWTMQGYGYSIEKHREIRVHFLEEVLIPHIELQILKQRKIKMKRVMSYFLTILYLCFGMLFITMGICKQLGYMPRVDLRSGAFILFGCIMFFFSYMYYRMAKK